MPFQNNEKALMMTTEILQISPNIFKLLIRSKQIIHANPKNKEKI